MGDPTLAERCRALVRDVPDYPHAGVMFKDITPLLADGPAFRAVVGHLVNRARAHGGVDLVAGMEARGFILGAPVATALGAGFVPVRKAGKLPRETFREEYVLEYGSAVLEIHTDDVPRGARVLVLDDILATGGTLGATAQLLHRAGLHVAGFGLIMELTDLRGRSQLGGHRVRALYRV